MQPTKLKITGLLLLLAGGLVWWSWHGARGRLSVGGRPLGPAGSGDPRRTTVSRSESTLPRELTPFMVMPALTNRLPAELSDRTFAQWRDRLRPESCLATVDWLPTLWDGVIAGQKEDKPILLWAMNGHPLGCT
jgi:hypothetical protein